MDVVDATGVGSTFRAISAHTAFVVGADTIPHRSDNTLTRNNPRPCAWSGGASPGMGTRPG